MTEAVRLIVAREATTPICVAVHGLFADNSNALLTQAGASVVTSNSIRHETNGIDLTALFAAGIREIAHMNMHVNPSGA
jgi:ribose-phosphate pyrophosphokinase